MQKQEWTTVTDVKHALIKKWNRGRLLQAYLDEQWDLFPMRIALKYPSGAVLSDHFSDSQQWVQQILSYAQNRQFTVEFADINHRTLGRNQIPVALIFATLDDTISFIGKVSQFSQFKQLSSQLINELPQLKEWVQCNPFVLLDHALVLTKLIRVVQWIIQNPRSHLYLRQLTIRDIDTKFIETYKKIIGEWLDILLDPADINQVISGVKNFEKRYGFLSKPDTIRFRILDKKLYINGLSDMCVRADEFCLLEPNVKKVFVTENDINGLAFPDIEDAIVLFGRGYGFESISGANWLKDKEIWYWGDIDTHGFAILNQFRYYFPQTRSLLMDRSTLLAHTNSWVAESSPTRAELDKLTDNELVVYNEIRDQKHGTNIRLEQESIGYEWVMRDLGVFFE